MNGMGLSPETRATLVNDLHIILNSAASIDFEEPLHDALQINYFGAVRILDLAHECKNLIALHHVSTAFVNSDFPNHSVVTEDIKPFSGGDDWEEWVNATNKMDPQMIEREEI